MVLAVAYALFGFGFIVGGDVVLSYCTDCYQDVRCAGHIFGGPV